MITPEDRAPAQTTRRRFLAATGAALSAVVAWPLLDATAAAATDADAIPSGTGPATVTIDFNDGWLFGPATTGGDQPGFDDSALATVSLPHTVTPLSWQEWDPASWEATNWLYRKHFDVTAPTGSRVFLDVGGALTGTALTINGTAVQQYVGGYLPFTTELTGQLRPRGNVLAAVLDAGFDQDVPPDRPGQASSSVDYWQPGGMYRDARLRLVPAVFLSDVFAKPVNVLDAATRAVVVQCTLDAATVPAGAASVTVELRDGNRRLGLATTPVTIAEGQTTITATITNLPSITLWSLDDPKLYDVIATVTIAGHPVHDYRTRIGFREATFQLDGFFLNGQRLKLFGLNRHQFFPYAGAAMPDRVQRKDAEILRRDLNCTFVRGSHYPQAEAFLDACDEIGLLVWEEIPGWGYFGDADWQAAAQRDLTEMITRDRNHPSIIVWGSMPNESGNHPAQYAAWNALAHSLDDSRQTGGDDDGFGAGASGFEFDVYSHHDYSHQTGPDGRQEPDLKAPTDAADKPYLVCEAVGTLSGPAAAYSRLDPQWVQQGQATAHARVQDIAASDDRYCGVAAWSGYDYPSGNGNQIGGVKYTGVIDLFRIPKPGAAMYQAQVDPRQRAVIQPAFYWDFGPTSPVNQLGPAMIASNLDSLEIYVGGTHFATITPDTTDYGQLPYPPSFVDFTSVDGTNHPDLRIDGYLGSRLVASQRLSSDPGQDRLQLVLDDATIDADGVDTTRLQVRAVDRYGAPRPYVAGDVSLSIAGPVQLVGDNPVPLAATGGACAVWLRSLRNSPGSVTITASHPTLGRASTRLRLRTVPPGGAPQPYGTVAVSPPTVLITAGASATVSATFANAGLPVLSTVALRLTVPAGWTATAVGRTTFAHLSPGGEVTTSWRVTAPAGTAPGQFTADLEAAYQAGQRAVSHTAIPLLVAYASLAAAYDNVGITDDSDVDPGNLDGVGNSYSLQALAAAGVTGGTTLTVAGVPVPWPTVAAGQPDNVLAQGQTVDIAGSGTTLAVIGAGSPLSAGTGTVYYADGHTSSFSLTLDNFFYAPTVNPVVAEMPYENSAGVAGRVHGQRDQTVYLFGTSTPVDSGSAVVAVTLPAGGSTGSGRISGMHIFALAIGS